MSNNKLNKLLMATTVLSLIVTSDAMAGRNRKPTNKKSPKKIENPVTPPTKTPSSSVGAPSSLVETPSNSSGSDSDNESKTPEGVTASPSAYEDDIRNYKQQVIATADEIYTLMNANDLADNYSTEIARVLDQFNNNTNNIQNPTKEAAEFVKNEMAYAELVFLRMKQEATKALNERLAKEQAAANAAGNAILYKKLNEARTQKFNEEFNDIAGQINAISPQYSNDIQTALNEFKTCHDQNAEENYGVVRDKAKDTKEALTQILREADNAKLEKRRNKARIATLFTEDARAARRATLDAEVDPAAPEALEAPEVDAANEEALVADDDAPAAHEGVLVAVDHTAPDADVVAARQAEAEVVGAPVVPEDDAAPETLVATAPAAAAPVVPEDDVAPETLVATAPAAAAPVVPVSAVAAPEGVLVAVDPAAPDADVVAQEQAEAEVVGAPVVPEDDAAPVVPVSAVAAPEGVLVAVDPAAPAAPAAAIPTPTARAFNKHELSIFRKLIANTTLTNYTDEDTRTSDFGNRVAARTAAAAPTPTAATRVSVDATVARTNVAPTAPSYNNDRNREVAEQTELQMRIAARMFAQEQNQGQANAINAAIAEGETRIAASRAAALNAEAAARQADAHEEAPVAEVTAPAVDPEEAFADEAEAAQRAEADAAIQTAAHTRIVRFFRNVTARQTPAAAPVTPAVVAGPTNAAHKAKAAARYKHGIRTVSDTISNALNTISSSVGNRIASSGDESKIGGNVWVKGFAGMASQKGANSFKNQHDGFTIGADILVLDDTLLLGAAYTRADMKAKIKDGKIKADANIGSLYGRYSLTDSIYTSAIASVGGVNAKFISKKNKGTAFKGEVNLGAIVNFDNGVFVSPKVGVSYQDIKISNTKDANVKVSHGKNRKVVANGSVSLGVKYAIGEMMLTPEVHAGISQVVSGGKNNTTLSENVNGAWQTIDTSALDSKDKTKTTYNFGTSVKVAGTQAVSLDLGYDLHMRKKYKAHSGFVKLSYKF